MKRVIKTLRGYLIGKKSRLNGRVAGRSQGSGTEIFIASEKSLTTCMVLSFKGNVVKCLMRKPNITCKLKEIY